MFFGKQKFDVKQLKLNKFIFDVKQLKINKFIFDVKQLKMNRFIKSISDLTISTSNATLEAPSLRPCDDCTWQLGDVPDQYKTQKMCNNAVKEYPWLLKYVPYWFVTH